MKDMATADSAPPKKTTKLCSFFAAGNCGYGESCTFSHDLGASTNTPNPNPTPNATPPVKSAKLCSFFAAGNCRFPESCTFSHDLAAAESAPKKSTKLCSFFAQGNCSYGDSCTFSHDPAASEESQDKNYGVCKNFANGYCKYGTNCAFKHEGDGGGGGGGWSDKNAGGGGWGGYQQGDKAGDWTCPKCSDNVFARNNRCRKCGTPKPGEELDPESELLEKYIDAVKKWQRLSPDNQPAWQKYCDENGSYGKYDPRRKDLAYLQQFASAKGIPSPDPEAEAAIGGRPAAAPASASETASPGIDMTDPNVIAQIQQAYIQQAYLQHQQALMQQYIDAGATPELAMQLVAAFYKSQEQK